MAARSLHAAVLLGLAVLPVLGQVPESFNLTGIADVVSCKLGGSRNINFAYMDAALNQPMCGLQSIAAKRAEPGTCPAKGKLHLSKHPGVEEN